jgi:hypothetical protein
MMKITPNFPIQVDKITQWRNIKETSNTTFYVQTTTILPEAPQFLRRFQRGFWDSRL